MSIYQSLHKCLLSLSASAAAIALTTVPGRAAEYIAIDFGPLSRTIPVASLEAYVEDGTIDDDLAFYLRLLGPEREAEFKTALTTNREADLVKLSQWFNSPMGERILFFAGGSVQTGARLNGQKAIRAALIASVADDDEISLLEVVQNYPTETVRLNLPLAIRNTRQVIDDANVTLALVEAVSQQSMQAATQTPPDTFTSLPDLTQLGPYGVERMDLVLQDPSRSGAGLLEGVRTYPVDLFLPQNYADSERPLPVVVISHGLGDSRISFRDVGAHLASYGFAVALPEHIGSNFDYRQALFQGLEDDTFAAMEFRDRPLDITFLLDELERTNTSDYQSKLALNRVAIAGHSFGGYTALALAGATIDFERLTQRCDPKANIVLDAAMLLECRALELTSDAELVRQLGETGVRDERVDLVMAFAPVSNLFGERGMGQVEIPTMIMGGAFDIIAPVVPQQALAFSWLQTPEKYFYLAENTSHSPGITGLTSRIFNIDQQFEQGVEEGLVLTRNLNKALIVAFSEVYLAENTAFAPFLTAAYVEAVSEAPFHFNFVRELPEDLSSPKGS